MAGVPYIDSNGVLWSIIEPTGDDPRWWGLLAQPAYGYPAARRLVFGDDEAVLKAGIDSYVAAQTPAPAPPKSDGSWLWLLVGLWLLDDKKGR